VQLGRECFRQIINNKLNGCFIKTVLGCAFVTTAFMVCEEVVKVDGKGLVTKNWLASFNGLFTIKKGHSN
jgi:hypothetical protein